MDILQKNDEFYKRFKGKKGYFGNALSGKPLPFYLIEKSSYPTVIVQYAIHAREYITSLLALRQIERFEKYGKAGRIFFIPLMNPDGVEICLTKNPLYKANGRGVDLNVNFDARWASGNSNTFICGSENFVGESPFSEPESLALKNFTLCVKPDITISYHSKGNEIYWEFYQDDKLKARDYVFAKCVADTTGYALKTAYGSAGGYKDWCIEKLKITALTIEVGNDCFTHPLGETHLDKIYEENELVLERLTELYNERNK